MSMFWVTILIILCVGFSLELFEEVSTTTMVFQITLPLVILISFINFIIVFAPLSVQ
ncbi:hypothetical protein BDC45DRAFT_504126 [Circinella umbellata]|nr:hypothetical protein BDC45DRAFT_504126 [Circinella umbellata]